MFVECSTMDSLRGNVEKVLENPGVSTKTEFNVEREFIDYLKLRVQSLEERNQTLENLLYQYLVEPTTMKSFKRAV